MRKKRLTNLTINEISGVDKGANQGAHVLFWKRDNQKDNNMDIEELAKRLEALEKSDADQKALIEKLEAEKAEAVAKAEDAAVIAKLDADDEAAFEKMSDEDKKKMLADLKAGKKMKKADDEAAKEDVNKAAFEAIEKANKDLSDKIAKMEAEKELDTFRATVAKRVPALASDEKADFVKALFGMDETLRETVLKEQEAAVKIQNQYMLEKGTAARGEDHPEAQLEKLYKAYSKENGVSEADAMEAVTKTEEGKALYMQTLKTAN